MKNIDNEDVPHKRLETKKSWFSNKFHSIRDYFASQLILDELKVISPTLTNFDEELTLDFNQLTELEKQGKSISQVKVLTLQIEDNIIKAKLADIFPNIERLNITGNRVCLAKGSISKFAFLNYLNIDNQTTVISSGSVYDCPKLAVTRVKSKDFLIYGGYNFAICPSLKDISIDVTRFIARQKSFEFCSAHSFSVLAKKMTVGGDCFSHSRTSSIRLKSLTADIRNTFCFCTYLEELKILSNNLKIDDDYMVFCPNLKTKDIQSSWDYYAEMTKRKSLSEKVLAEASNVFNEERIKNNLSRIEDRLPVEEMRIK